MKRSFGLLLLLLLLGCGGGPVSEPVAENAEPASPAADATRTDAAPAEPLQSALQPAEEADQAAEQPAAEKADQAAPEPRESAETISESPAAELTEEVSPEKPTPPDAVAKSTAPPRERFILLAPGGPLIVDLLLRINGEAYSAAHERLVDAALAAADEDGDGQPWWEEVANSPRFAYGQFGNLPVDSEDDKRQLIRMYDRNRDGLVNRDELPRFLTRNAGGARSFSLRSSNEYRGDNRTRSPVRLALDADLDGAITAAEFRAAPLRLLQHDADDDEILAWRDFTTAARQTTGQMSNRRRTTEPDTALLIRDGTNWDYARYSLRELYSYGDPLGESDWPMVPQLFGQLDKDGNQQLDGDEIQGLADVPAHVQLTAEFGKAQREQPADQRPGPQLEIELVSADVENFVVAVHRHGSRVSIVLRDAEVEFFVNEDPALASYLQVAQNRFAMLDTDQNGYLDEDEFPDRLPGYDVPLEAVDQNGDGQVYEEELAAFLELRQAAYRGQVRARAADQQDALFTALDLDGDGRLDAREIHRSPERLQAMDRNRDGRLQSHEIPGSMVVGFIRGNPQQDNALLTMPNTGRRLAEQTPRWFRGMDANGDGEISAREFLGPAAKFRQLDANGDGFVGTDEVPSGEDETAESQSSAE